MWREWSISQQKLVQSIVASDLPTALLQNLYFIWDVTREVK